MWTFPRLPAPRREPCRRCGKPTRVDRAIHGHGHGCAKLLGLTGHPTDVGQTGPDLFDTLDEENPAMDGTARGRLLNLVLDACDPRLTTDQRGTALEQAIDSHPELAFTIAAGMLHGVLSGIGAQFGEAASGSVMRQLAARSLSLLPDGP
jgi:hypothetical protein